MDIKHTSVKWYIPVSSTLWYEANNDYHNIVHY